MKLYSHISDNFFSDPLKVRKEVLGKSHAGRVNPFDKVFYPDINIDFGTDVIQEIIGNISLIVQAPIKDPVIFTRLSVKGVKAPHSAHTDTIMAQYTLLVYLNPTEQCQGGTELVEHISGKLSVNPTTQDLVDLWKADTNIQDKWKVVSNCPMAFNRAFLIDSNLFHRAQPFEGFGTDLQDGRLVLTCFFNIQEEKDKNI